MQVYYWVFAGKCLYGSMVFGCNQAQDWISRIEARLYNKMVGLLVVAIPNAAGQLARNEYYRPSPSLA